VTKGEKKGKGKRRISSPYFYFLWEGSLGRRLRREKVGGGEGRGKEKKKKRRSDGRNSVIMDEESVHALKNVELEREKEEKKKGKRKLKCVY